MPPEQVVPSDIVNQLTVATKRGSVTWDVVDASDNESFRAELTGGAVELSHLVTFALQGQDGPIALTLLDQNGRTVFQYRPMQTTYATFKDLEALYDMVRIKALNLDMSIAMLLEDIKKRSGS